MVQRVGGALEQQCDIRDGVDKTPFLEEDTPASKHKASHWPPTSAIGEEMALKNKVIHAITILTKIILFLSD